jgi:hypothetical protein
MERDKFIEYHSEDLKIVIEGEGDIFGSLDLKVRAIKALIANIDFKFAEEIDEYAKDKVFLQIIDSLGSLIKSDAMFPQDSKQINIDVTRKYLEWVIEVKQHEIPQINFLLDAVDDE